MPHLVVSSLLLINLIMAVIASKGKSAVSTGKCFLLFGVLIIIPEIIVLAGLFLQGLPFDGNRSSFAPRALPVHGLFFGDILFAAWMVIFSKSARWFVSSVCLIFLWITLFCYAFAIMNIINNIFIWK